MERTDLLRTGTASEANRSGLDQTGCGLERNGPAVREAAPDLDWTGPDQTGPDRTGPDRTGPDQTRLDWTGPDWTGLDWAGLELS